MIWLKRVLSILSVALVTLASILAALDTQHSILKAFSRLGAPLALIVCGILAGWVAVRLVGDAPCERVISPEEWSLVRPWQLTWAGCQLAVFVALIGIMLISNQQYVGLIIAMDNPDNVAMWLQVTWHIAAAIGLFLAGCLLLNRTMNAWPRYNALWQMLTGLVCVMCLVHLYVPGLVAATLGPFAHRIRELQMEQLQQLLQ